MRETLRTVSMVDAVCDALRERILGGQLDPEEVIYEQATADLYGVSRPTAKAAIDRLVSSGLLRRSANKSARVPRLTEDDVHDLYLSRLMIEGQAVAHLAERRLDPAPAKKALAEFDLAVKEGSVQGIVRSDIAFHYAFVERLGSPRVLRMYDSIIGEAHLCMVVKQTRHLINPKGIAKEHREIYRAVVEGEAGTAQTKLAQHLNRSENVIRSYFRETDSSR
ncbi:GntR family transcriptional regulator [Actinopolymorpha sp. NPDC004070]|uniref:GntR family transcriptional regulator n=1 Tax=Actinopolymorpha sp. NPDC004070 TaxID=3154548 RepID=UPI0033AC7054